MKYAFLIVAAATLLSCSDSFINHSLKAEKVGVCASEEMAVKMLSNIAGERYEFNVCVDENYDPKNYTVDRKGDSIIVTFPKPSGKSAAYKMTLDMDAKPAYHHIFLDGKEILVSQQEGVPQ